MEFTKMQGTGNDFVVMEYKNVNFEHIKDIAVKLCDRHFGIGADGLILVCDSEIYDARMRIFNSDGSEAEMCGNGIRCFAKYLYDRGIVTKNKMYIETLAGLIIPEIYIDTSGKVEKVRVNMGKPTLEREKIPAVGSGIMMNEPLVILGKTIIVSSVNTGVPHAVVFTDDIDEFEVDIYGPAIEKNKNFPLGTNVDFVQVLGENKIKIKTWERGAGLTLACGSGACAAAYISHMMGYTDNQVNVCLPGGELFVEIEDNIYMTGQCKEVFVGNIDVTM